MGSALLNTAADLEFAASIDNFASALSSPARSDVERTRAASVAGTAEELRAQVAERLAAHRSRRGTARAQAATEPARPAAVGRSAQIAAAVAERYARTPSYRELLAAEAERAIQQARAAAEVAALNARAIAAAQQRLLEAYDEHASREQALWPELAIRDEDAEREETARTMKKARRAAMRSAAANDSVELTATATARPVAGLTVHLYEDGAERGSVVSARSATLPGRGRLGEERGYGADRSYRQQRSGFGADRSGFIDDRSDDEAMALDDEIAFRRAPVFEEPAGPPVALPANLIEFPRQLVAARKARPRYAEGPLRDEMEAAAGDGQLRIFEVDPAQISSSPAEAERAQWTSLWLDGPAHPTHPTRAAATTEEVAADALMDEPLARAIPALQPASLARRAAAGAINLAMVACGLLAFAGVVAMIAGHGVAWHGGVRQAGRAMLDRTGFEARSMATIGAVSGAFLLLLYHALFFWFSSATPGMRSVRIALCTFEDENPTRAGVRRRMAAAMLSSCSLGMGYAWAALDEQRLTWHDRISRMYLRRY